MQEENGGDEREIASSSKDKLASSSTSEPKCEKLLKAAQMNIQQREHKEESRSGSSPLAASPNMEHNIPVPQVITSEPSKLPEVEAKVTSPGKMKEKLPVRTSGSEKKLPPARTLVLSERVGTRSPSQSSRHTLRNKNSSISKNRIVAQVNLNAIQDLIVDEPAPLEDYRVVSDVRPEWMNKRESASRIEDEYSTCCCCFTVKRSKYSKGYTGKIHKKKIRPPHANSFELSLTKVHQTGVPLVKRRSERKGDRRGFYMVLWSAVMGAMKKTDVQKMTVAQVRFFLPILLQYGHLKPQLVEKTRNDLALRMEMYLWIRSNPDPVAKEYVEVESFRILDEEFGNTADFYYHWVLEPELKQGDQIVAPSNVYVPLQTDAKARLLDRAVFKTKFASGHGPVLVELKYKPEDLVSSGGFSPQEGITSADADEKGRRNVGGTPTSSPQSPRRDKNLRRSASDRHVHMFGKFTAAFNRSRDKIRQQFSHRDVTSAAKKADANADRNRSITVRSILIKPDAVCRAAGVSRMMELFNYLWRNSWMHGHTVPQALHYTVVPGGEKWGFIECIKDAKSVKDFDFSTVERLNARSIKDPIAQHKVTKFLKTVVGGLVAGHVLGLRDRHSDNILISEGYKFYHIDFKHCFNLQTKVVDAPSMVIPKGLHKLLLNMRYWDKFLDQCVEAFTVLRRSNEHLIHISQLIFAGQVDPDVIEKSYINSFYLGTTESKAKAMFKNHVRDLPGSLSSKIKEFVHANSPNLRKKDSSRSPERQPSSKVSTPKRISVIPSPLSTNQSFPFSGRRRSSSRGNHFGKSLPLKSPQSPRPVLKQVIILYEM
mmetsp:Transcript_19437/g.32075  ORF Transcript_19437/g.32075 Transcript_19437/m.32075 type:complete len:826 (-) Transcript_19437:377-2854(-)